MHALLCACSEAEVQSVCSGRDARSPATPQVYAKASKSLLRPRLLARLAGGGAAADGRCRAARLRHGGRRRAAGAGGVRAQVADSGRLRVRAAVAAVAAGAGTAIGGTRAQCRLQVETREMAQPQSHFMACHWHRTSLPRSRCRHRHLRHRLRPVRPAGRDRLTTTCKTPIGHALPRAATGAPDCGMQAGRQVGWQLVSDLHSQLLGLHLPGAGQTLCHPLEVGI